MLKLTFIIPSCVGGFLALIACGLSFSPSPVYAAGAPTDAPVKFNLQKRMEAFQPFDGNGRYTMLQTDGVRGTQGLDALASRFGAKPYADLSDGKGKWQTERVEFHDVDTGARMWMLTRDRWADGLSYFQGNWNADGSTIVWRRSPGMFEPSTSTHGPMAMNADGTGMRNVFRDYRMVRETRCSTINPNMCFALANDDKTLVAFDLRTGLTNYIIKNFSHRSQHLKRSIDGKYLMSRAIISDGKPGLWIISVDGKDLHEIPVPQPIHDSYDFHPSQKKIIFWYEGKFYAQGFMQMNFDGSDLHKVPDQFDWNHGDLGLDRGAHTGGNIYMIHGDTWGPAIPLFKKPGEEKYDNPANNNGYATWWPKDELWMYFTRIVFKPYISEISCAYCAPVPDYYANRYRVCSTGLLRGQYLDDPNASPDGTKVLFNSDMLGNDGIYCLLARLPEQPLHVASQSGPDGATITWQPAHHHAETAGYYVYRSKTSGIDFHRITSKPITGPHYLDATAKNGQTYFYAVTAAEHSGLESCLSDEASVGKVSNHHIYINADSAKLSTDMWIALLGNAADLHYIWMRKKGGHGIAKFTIDARGMRGPVTLWARVKGGRGAAFTASAGGRPVDLSSAATTAWTWVKAATALDIKGQRLELTSDKYGSAVDQLVLSDDANFTPANATRIQWPRIKQVKNITAKEISPYTIKVNWDTAGAPVDHYNVYCGSSDDFAVDQRALVRSPFVNSIVDWGLKPGHTYYYRVAAVDPAGNLSAPSRAVKVQTPEIARFVVEKKFSPSIALNLPSNGTYVVWLRINKPSKNTGTYINVHMDAKQGGMWVGIPDGLLAEQSWLSYGQWGRFNVDAGKHVLSIENKTADQIDKVLITNDESFTPPGHVSILTGW